MLILPSQALAKDPKGFELRVQSDVTIYEKPNLDSDVMGILSRGDRAQISSKTSGLFRKILFHDDQQEQKVGYVLIAELGDSEIVSKDPQNQKRPSYWTRKSVGVAIMPSWLRQAESSFQLSDSSVYQTSEFTSSSLIYSAFVDFPVSETWGVRVYGTLRQTDFKGEAKLSGAAGNVPTNQVSRQQSLYGVGFVSKVAFKPNSWWWGLGAELAFGNQVKLKINNIDVPTSENDKPLFVIGFGSLGGEVGLPFLNKFYFIPELRVGAIATTDPVTLLVEGLLGVAYQL